MASGCTGGCARRASTTWWSIRRASRSIAGRAGPRRIGWMRQAVAAVAAVGRGRAQGLECGARADAGGGSGAAADARDRRRCGRIGRACAIGSRACWRRKGIRLRADAPFLRASSRRVQTGDGRPAAGGVARPAGCASGRTCRRLRRAWRPCARRGPSAITDGRRPGGAVARQLCRLRGVAETSAALFSAELFGTRTFANGRQLGALTGLGAGAVSQRPTRAGPRHQQSRPRASCGASASAGVVLAALATGQRVDGVVSRAGSRRPAGGAGGLALWRVARKLVIALWRFVEHGVVPEGAQLKPTRRIRRAAGRARPHWCAPLVDLRVPPGTVLQMERRALRSSACVQLVRDASVTTDRRWSGEVARLPRTGQCDDACVSCDGGNERRRLRGLPAYAEPAPAEAVRTLTESQGLDNR